MVMATYSPQYVGQEFVRQYYTMLHKDPMKLHSFYVSHSVFTHGTPTTGKAEKPITGLEAIKDKICQLNFQDCRAVIRTLDSHPTIGGGVVVQVSGELSNADCPMRRFTQTFVLAPEDPVQCKKYFVFNDIFRYQDEVFEETEDETHEETADSYADEQANYQLLLANHQAPALQIPSQPNNDVVQSPVAETFTSTAPLLNEPVDFVEEEEPLPTEDFAPQNTESVQVETVAAPLEAECLVQESEPVRAETPVSTAPVSWAAVLKKNSSQAQGIVTKQAPQAKNPPPSPRQLQTQQPPQQQNASRKKEDTPTKSPSIKDEGSHVPRKSSAPLADNCQIFIGNLPNGIQESDVHDAFKDYGTIVEVRLNSKSFGFVAFDNAESAQTLLELPKGKIVINSQEINIEKKRASMSNGQRPYNRRDRHDSGPARKSSGPGSGRGQYGGGRGRGGGSHQDGERSQRGGGRGRDRAPR